MINTGDEFYKPGNITKLKIFCYAVHYKNFNLFLISISCLRDYTVADKTFCKRVSHKTERQRFSDIYVDGNYCRTYFWIQ